MSKARKYTEEEKEWLKANFRYDPTTGVLERFVDRTKTWREVTTTAISRGYACMSIYNESHKVHRLCWLLAHGDIDENLEIHHRNKIRTDNRLSNLFLVTCRENNQDKTIHDEGKTVGAHWQENTRSWRSSIKVHGKYISLGSYTTEEEASNVYWNAVTALEKSDDNLEAFVKSLGLKKITRRGTYFNKQRGNWVAHMKVNGKSTYIGSFPSEEEAHSAYIAAKEKTTGG